MTLKPSSFVLALVIGVVPPACSDSSSSSDPRQEAISYAREDISCTTDEECCAVLDGCLAQFLIVSAQDQARVKELLESAPADPCVGCIPPTVQVDCRAGRCVGVELESVGGNYDELPNEFWQTHCGKLDVPAGWEEKPASDVASEPTSYQPKTVIGC